MRYIFHIRVECEICIFCSMKKFLFFFAILLNLNCIFSIKILNKWSEFLIKKIRYSRARPLIWIDYLVVSSCWDRRDRLHSIIINLWLIMCRLALVLHKLAIKIKKKKLNFTSDRRSTALRLFCHSRNRENINLISKADATNWTNSLFSEAKSGQISPCWLYTRSPKASAQVIGKNAEVLGKQLSMTIKFCISLQFISANSIDTKV